MFVLAVPTALPITYLLGRLQKNKACSACRNESDARFPRRAPRHTKCSLGCFVLECFGRRSHPLSRRLAPWPVRRGRSVNRRVAMEAYRNTTSLPRLQTHGSYQPSSTPVRRPPMPACFALCQMLPILLSPPFLSVLGSAVPSASCPVSDLLWAPSRLSHLYPLFQAYAPSAACLFAHWPECSRYARDKCRSKCLGCYAPHWPCSKRFPSL